MLSKCHDADTYAALSPPKCGCETCVAKWQEAQRRRIITTNKGTRHEAAIEAKYGRR